MEPFGVLMRVSSVSTAVGRTKATVSTVSPLRPQAPADPDEPADQDTATSPGSPADHDFHDFYRNEADGIYRALALALGDVDLAQEAANEGMARAYQRWRKISRYDSPAGWVYRVGLNWARSRLRKTANEVLTIDTDQRTRASADPLVEHLDHDLDPDLRAALAGLSIDARAVVVLRYLLEWSTVDTAEALGIAQGTVKSRLSRALAELESTLEER